MADSRTNGEQKESGEGREADRVDHPAELARRELVEWCKAHRLPVPAEPRRPR